MHKGRALAFVGLAACAAVIASAVAGAAIVNTKPYAVPLPGTGYQTKILISAGERVPETSQPGKQYQMVGIPDGLGAYRTGRGRSERIVAFMNHELGSAVQSEPVVGDPLNRGAIVTK